MIEKQGGAATGNPVPNERPEQEKSLVKRQALKDCCKDTINAHAFYNPMMLCPECKHLIKCFLCDSNFRNYTTFCSSRGRQVYVDTYATYQVVVFRNYEPYR